MAVSKKTPAAKKPAKKTASGRAPRKPRVDLDDDLDDADEMVDALDEMEDDGEVPARGTRRMAPGDRQSAELEAALKLKQNGLPVFPFPPELKDHHKPYWTELVNSKPHDYFNRGDIPLLKLYCRAAADIDRLDEEIEREGSVILNARDNPVVNPRVVVRSIAETRLMALAVKLRAQPAARYDSENDRKQTEKTKRASQAADSLEKSHDHGGDDDEDGLLAGSGSRTVQ